jgi:hypothetical protein
MCTIVIASRAFADFPLVVAANRDEAFDRPAQGPALRSFGPGRSPVLAPLDLRAGGTWVGLNRHGIFVGITNRHTSTPDLTRRSRGHLVSRALDCESVREARRWAEGVEVERYNPFHLVVVDRSSGFVLWNRDDTPEIYELGPGVHVLTERFAGYDAGPKGRSAPTERPERVRGLFEQWGDQTPGSERLQTLLADHRGVGFEDVRVEIEGQGYGTRSALTLSLDAQHLADSRLTWSDVAPTQDSFVDSSLLLADLFG